MSKDTERSTSVVVQEAVTRRDFVGGTLVGAGAALLGMASPAAMRSVQAQTVASPMTGLGPGWTGPGGIGDYARSNGNTHEVVNAAHGGIRNQEFDKLLRAATDTGEKVDVVIVGCGIAGLSACWTYRKGRPDGTVLMLDQHPIFGGEAKQNEFEVDGYHLTAPQGATGIVVPFNRAKEAGFASHFSEDLGFPEEFVYQKPTGLSRDILVPEDCWTPMHIGWERADIGYFYEGKGWVKNAWRDGFKSAPIPEAAKRALIDMELYRTPPRREDWDRWLDSMTYQQFLTDVMGIDAGVLAEVVRYLNPMTAAMGCGLGADVISAYSAYNFIQPGVIGYSRYLTGGADPTDTIYLASFPGGHAGTARHFLKKILPAALVGRISNGRYPQQPRAVGSARSLRRAGPDAFVFHCRVRHARRGARVGERRRRDLSARRQAVPRPCARRRALQPAAREPAHLPRCDA